MDAFERVASDLRMLWKFFASVDGRNLALLLS